MRVRFTRSYIDPTTRLAYPPGERDVPDALAREAIAAGAARHVPGGDVPERHRSRPDRPAYKED